MNLEPDTFPAFLQAIGVVAVYSLIRDGIPKLLGRNGKNDMTKDDYITIKQHDKECKLKLTPLKDKLEEVHKDLKDYIRHQGIQPPSDGQ